MQQDTKVSIVDLFGHTMHWTISADEKKYDPREGQHATLEMYDSNGNNLYETSVKVFLGQAVDGDLIAGCVKHAFMQEFYKDPWKKPVWNRQWLKERVRDPLNLMESAMVSVYGRSMVKICKETMFAFTKTRIAKLDGVPRRFWLQYRFDVEANVLLVDFRCPLEMRAGEVLGNTDMRLQFTTAINGRRYAEGEFDRPPVIPDIGDLVQKYYDTIAMFYRSLNA